MSAAGGPGQEPRMTTPHEIQDAVDEHVGICSNYHRHVGDSCALAPLTDGRLEALLEAAEVAAEGSGGYHAEWCLDPKPCICGLPAIKATLAAILNPKGGAA